MNKINKTFMAVKVGKESVEGAFKLYKGMAAFNMIAVNPTKKELETLQGRDIENEPEYKGKNDDGVDTMRVVFYAKTNPEAKVNGGIELMIPISFMLTKAQRVGQTSGKIQVIDKYGRTAWATPEEVASKAIPQYASGPANISKDYRPAYQGEEQLIDFLIQWLNIPYPATYKDSKWVMRTNPEDSEVSLNIDAIFKGDVKELQELVKLAPSYLVKAAVGIKTTEEGKQYQAVFTRKFAKNAITNYSKIDAAITEFQAAGGAPNTEFSVEPLHENVVEATQFTPKADATAPAGDMPFDAPAGGATPWD